MALLHKVLTLRNRPRSLWHKLVRRLRARRVADSYRHAFVANELLIETDEPRGDLRFTVATPVFRVAEEHLRAAIDSVRRQSYRNWELILLDDASPEPHVARLLSTAAAGDPRIRVERRSTTGGIAVASDEIVASSTGDYVAFLDHDDLLHERALELAAGLLGREPTIDWLFTDEDKLAPNGEHIEPCFKPGWSRHLLLGFNYVAHLRIVRRAMLDRIGGHRQGFDGAQDYDLALRALAAGGRFAQLPGVMYHWRVGRGSMARLATDKPTATANALRALAEHASGWAGVDRVETEVLLESAPLFRVRAWPEQRPSLAILRSSTAADAVAALGSTETLVLVDEGLSWPALIAALASCHSELVVVPPPGGIKKGQLDEMLGVLAVPGTAAVAGRFVRGGRIRESGVVVETGGHSEDPWVSLACADPGYLNLALLPGRRDLLPARGWLGWKHLLLAAWDAAKDQPPSPWRLAVGCARLGLELVTTPTVTFAAPSGAPRSLPLGAPSELLPSRPQWPRQFGLL